MEDQEELFASAPGAVVVRPFAFILEDDTTDFAYISAKESEEEWGPGFFHKKLDESAKAAKSRVIVTSTGRYRYDEAGVPIAGAKLLCPHCHFSEVYSSLAHLEENIPEDCEQQDKECPMYHGLMKAQYDRRNGR